MAAQKPTSAGGPIKVRIVIKIGHAATGRLWAQAGKWLSLFNSSILRTKQGHRSAPEKLQRFWYPHHLAAMST